MTIETPTELAEHAAPGLAPETDWQIKLVDTAAPCAVFRAEFAHLGNAAARPAGRTEAP